MMFVHMCFTLTHHVLRVFSAYGKLRCFPQIMEQDGSSDLVTPDPYPHTNVTSMNANQANANANITPNVQKGISTEDHDVIKLQSCLTGFTYFSLATFLNPN